MANTIKPKRSATASKVPTTTDLASGEIGVNMADQKVYINNGTSVVQVGAGKLSALGETAISSPASGQALVYNGTNWANAAVSGGQYFGSAATKAIAYNANSISENVTITAGNNGLSAGPITINTGFTVTVATGAVWVIV